MRRLWIDWFKRLVDISQVLGAEGIGSHFGILSFRDYDDREKRMGMLQDGCRNWADIADYAAQKGLKYVYFEPMSVPREFAGTLDETRMILDLANRHIKLPMLLCLDVDHGDVESPNPDDTNPYKWLEVFAHQSPIIHLKQSRLDKGGHHPFTAEHNAHGRILPDKVLDTLLSVDSTDNTLILELAHKERWPSDYTVIQDFQESITYWREALSRFESKMAVKR
jgi:sugar phosphate isomerase/epimerase